MQDLDLLKNNFINQRLYRVKIKGDQDPAVIKVLFSLLTSSNSRSSSSNCSSSSRSSVCSLYIESSNLPQWIEHIKKIGPCLRDLAIQQDFLQSKLIATITEYCPDLEKLNLKTMLEFLHSNTLLNTIATNCAHIRSLDIAKLSYQSCAEADADLTAFAEKCPQLEELSFRCYQLTDQSVIALTQHCSGLNKLIFYGSKFTATSLITLTERGLPLEELGIPGIPIPSDKIAAQCVYALSWIRELSTSKYINPIGAWLHAIQYMTGLREIVLESSEDHQLVSRLLILEGHCAELESLTIKSDSSVTSQLLSELVVGCSNLHKLTIYHPTCISDAVLLALARSCPRLQEVRLSCSEVTEEGVLVLAAHCRQLRKMFLTYITLTEETVRQLARHCPHLTKFSGKVFTELTFYAFRNWSWTILRKLRTGGLG